VGVQRFVSGERTEGGGALRIPGVPGYNGAGGGGRIMTRGIAREGQTDGAMIVAWNGGLIFFSF